MKKQQNFKQAEISNRINKHINNTKRRDNILWLNEDSNVVSNYLTFFNELQIHLNRELYLGLHSYESHFSIYEEGGFYEKHKDTFKNSKNRIVTTLYYLNENYTQSDKGELILYNEDNTIIRTIFPKENTLVIFLSDRFPHEVKTTKKRRYSIAGWFRIDKN